MPLRVPGGFSSDSMGGFSGEGRPGGRANVSVFTVVGEGCSRFVETKWSVAQLLTVKHICFDNFYLKVGLGPPVVALASQSSPQSSPGMLQMPPILLQRFPKRIVLVRALG